MYSKKLIKKTSEKCIIMKHGFLSIVNCEIFPAKPVICSTIMDINMSLIVIAF